MVAFLKKKKVYIPAILCGIVAVLKMFDVDIPPGILQALGIHAE